MGSRHYTLKEKAQALLALQAEDGNQSKVARMEGMPSRKTLRKWQRDKSQILEDYHRMKKIEESDEEITAENAEEAVKNAKTGENYELAKNYLAGQFSEITDKATKIAIRKLNQADPKDAMWIASTGLDKLMKLKGEPDQIIEVRNVILHKVVMKMREAVKDGTITMEQADEMAKKFDEIEEAEYEEIN